MFYESIFSSSILSKENYIKEFTNYIKEINDIQKIESFINNINDLKLPETKFTIDLVVDTKKIHKFKIIFDVKIDIKKFEDNPIDINNKTYYPIFPILSIMATVKEKIKNDSEYTYEPYKIIDLSAGQSLDTIVEILTHYEIKKANIFLEDLLFILNMWKDYHLNDITAGCIHQEELLELINNKMLDEFKNTSIITIDRKFENINMQKINPSFTELEMKILTEGYKGLIESPIFKECPICKYGYGNAWNIKIIPGEKLIKFKNIVNNYKNKTV